MLEDQLPLRQDDASEGWSSCANRPRVQLHGSGILNLVAQIHSIGRTYSEVGVDLFRRKHLFWLFSGSSLLARSRGGEKTAARRAASCPFETVHVIHAGL